MEYDVVIIGAGPAGLFAAYELAEKTGMKVAVIDEGSDLAERKCPMPATGVCVNCRPCHIMSGVGGAGGLSDGTLNIRPDIGGNLFDYLPEAEAWELVHYVENIWVRHGTPRRLYQATDREDEGLKRKAASAGIEFIHIPQRHIGSDHTPEVIGSIKDHLLEKGVTIILKTVVDEILDDGVLLADGRKIGAGFIVAAPGRSGSSWLMRQALKKGIKFIHGPIDVGVRVEVPAIIMDPVCRINRDPKFHIITRTYDDFIRTFCVNHQGFIVKETYKNYVGVNGHSLRDVRSDNTNFAFLTRIRLTEPIENSTDYGESIARIATTLGGGNPLLQRLGDLRRGRRSTWKRISSSHVKPSLREVTPGDIAMVMPHRVVTDILEGLGKLDEVIPGVASDSTLIYAPEIKYCAIKVETNADMRTSINNLFIAGDGAGVSRGLIVASATGVMAARGIMGNGAVAPSVKV